MSFSRFGESALDFGVGVQVLGALPFFHCEIHFVEAVVGPAGELGDVGRIRSDAAGVLERVEGGGELALAQKEDREIQEQAEIFWGEVEGLAVVVDGAVDFAFGKQELGGGIVSGGNFFDGGRGAGAGVGFEARDVGEIDGVVVNGEADDIVIAADGGDFGGGDGRRIVLMG